MTYECCCADISIEEWERKMTGAKPVNYKWLVRKIKKHLPWMYKNLDLKLFNPWENACSVTKTHYILVHSAIEYFILKN